MLEKVVYTDVAKMIWLFAFFVKRRLHANMRDLPLSKDFAVTREALHHLSPVCFLI